MSRMLPLIHAGWASVQARAKAGRRREALDCVKRLLSRSDLPTSLAADAHRLAGELLIDGEKYAKGRRHLRAAAALEPKHARTQYLIGMAYENDPHGEDRRAAARYRNATVLEPKNALYSACFGRAAVRCDRTKLGVRTMLAAADAALADVNVIRVAISGLLEAGRTASARRVLTKARFLAPNNRQLTELWTRVRFETARLQQNTWEPQDANNAKEGAISTLPFVKLVGAADRTDAGHGTIRMDAFSKSRPHFPKLLSLKADR